DEHLHEACQNDRYHHAWYDEREHRDPVLDAEHRQPGVLQVREDCEHHGDGGEDQCRGVQRRPHRASLLHRGRGSVHTRRMARVPKKHEGVKGLLDNLNEALVILDPALEVVEWNPAMERLTGVRSADAIGRSAAAILPLFRDTTLVPLIRRAMAGATPDAIELPHTVAGDDRVLSLRARCVPWRDDEGAVSGAIALFSDVSDQQRHALLLLAMEAIGQSLTSSLDLNEVLDTIVNKALEVMGAESAMVVLGDGTAPEFRVM